MSSGNHFRLLGRIFDASKIKCVTLNHYSEEFYGKELRQYYLQIEFQDDLICKIEASEDTRNRQYDELATLKACIENLMMDPKASFHELNLNWGQYYQMFIDGKRCLWDEEEKD